jgi:hypothetical protein
VARDRSQVGDLPCLGDLPVAEVGDHCLVNAESASSGLNAAEVRRQGAGDQDASHFHVSVDEDLLNFVE